MKKILHISKYYYPYSGGTEQIARDCVRALKGKYEQKVIAFSEVIHDKSTVVDGVDIFKCGTLGKISSQPISITYKKNLRKLLDNFQPDILIFHYPNPLVASFLLPLIKSRRAKLVVYWHLDVIKQKILKCFFVNQNKKLLERADIVVATSPNYIEGSSWLKSVKNKCVVVPNCINIERMTLNSQVEERAKRIKEKYKDKIICLAVGRHTEYKGFTYLVQASKNLDNRFEIFITSSGELTNKLKKEAKEDKKIHFTGNISDVELKAYFLASDIFCFPSISKNEAFGLALAEAMYYEKPAVTFTIAGSGVNYVCLNGVTGIEVENKNVYKYTEAIKILAEDSEIRNRYGKAAKLRVVENFLSTEYYKNIRGMIESLIN